MKSSGCNCRAVFTAAVLLACAGCGGRSSAEVEGNVLFEGEPVQQGTIRFFPVEQDMGQGAGTDVVDGRYKIVGGEGLVAGSYTIVITAVRATGRQIRRVEVDPGESPTIAETVQFLPKRYNEPGELTATLDAGANVQDFSLTP